MDQAKCCDPSLVGGDMLIDALSVVPSAYHTVP